MTVAVSGDPSASYSVLTDCPRLLCETCSRVVRTIGDLEEAEGDGERNMGSEERARRVHRELVDN